MFKIVLSQAENNNM